MESEVSQNNMDKPQDTTDKYQDTTVSPPWPITASTGQNNTTDFDHIGYTRDKCSHLNKTCAEKESGIFLPCHDSFGPFAFYWPYEWSQATKDEFLQNGKLPVSHEDIALDQQVMLIVFAQVRCRSEMFPGSIDDLGRPECFIRITHGTLKPLIFNFEAVDAFGEGVGVDGQPDPLNFIVPSVVLDEESRREITHDYLRYGKREVNALGLKSGEALDKRDLW